MENQIKFATLVIEDGVAKETNVKMMNQSDIAKCPFLIFMPEYYRQDGSCKCSNREHRRMMIEEWEYKKSQFKNIKLVD